MANYGALSEVVAASGSIAAAGSAIALAWRGRRTWEPSEEDVPKGGQKVGGLVAAVIIAVIWADLRSTKTPGTVSQLALALALVTVISLLAYGFLLGNQTYVLQVDAQRERRIIGGFRLTPEARRMRKERSLTVQQVFAGAAYDVDKIWSRPSRQLAKGACVLSYLGLEIAGTVALATAAVRIGISARG